MSAGRERRAPQLLVVDDLTVKFGGVTALSEVSMVVTPGSIHALIGPNGAGKSTFFNVISGLYPISSGSVRYGGHDLGSTRPFERASLGIGRGFQNITLSLGSTVLDNVMTGRHALTRGGFFASAVRSPRMVREQHRHEQRCLEICSILGLADLAHRPVSTLSYGAQKRVDLARALSTEPGLLLLDEPAAGLNAEETFGIGEIILEMRRSLGFSVLLIDHDMSLIMGIADKVDVLDFGRLIASGQPDEVRRDPNVTRAYLGVGAESGKHGGADS